MKRIKILGIPIDAVTQQQAAILISRWLEPDAPRAQRHIVTPNPEMLLESMHNPGFARILQNASLALPDGFGLLWASAFLDSARRSQSKSVIILRGAIMLMLAPLFHKMVTRILPQRVAGVDCMIDICRIAAKNGHSIFLLGAAPGVADDAKAVLQKALPGLKVCGTFSGSPHTSDLFSIQALIEQKKPDILFVAFGAPQQEEWIARNLKRFKSVRIAMGVGGAFDFISGKRKRAPELLQRIGLEWLYRLIQEPQRIARIYNATIRFPATVIRERLGRP